MTVELPPVPVPQPSAAPMSVEARSFDERWVEWQAKGDARDRRFRRKMAIAAPFLIVAAALIGYVLVGR